MSDIANLHLRRTPDQAVAAAGTPPADPDIDGARDAWERLESYRLDPRQLAHHRVISATRVDPAHVAFDLLRTRLMQALTSRGWRNVAITSPTKGCGKTFVAANLALSLSRRASCRTILLDMDLRLPSVAAVLGVRDAEPIHGFLTGERSFDDHLRKVAPNLAVGVNSTPIYNAAELLQEPTTSAALTAMQAVLNPDVVLYDLPPALACDDVIAFLPNVDGVLLIAAGGMTTAEEVRNCERLFEGQTQLLGVILNRAENASTESYYG